MAATRGTWDGRLLKDLKVGERPAGQGAALSAKPGPLAFVGRAPRACCLWGGPGCRHSLEGQGSRGAEQRQPQADTLPLTHAWHVKTVNVREVLIDRG